MTRKDALAQLIAKVEAGTLCKERHGGVPILTGMYRHSGGLDGPWSDVKAMSAYHGSLDAAKALHEAVLPGRGWALTDIGEAHILSADGPIAAGESDNPARAWLLSILRALHAMEAE